MAHRPAHPATLVIACGALARELVDLRHANGWDHMDVTCIPAKLHNRPQLIPAAMTEKIRSARGRYDRILALIGDCGTGGALDDVLATEGVERIAGAHCYEFLTGSTDFATLHEDEPTTFYLTDFLVRQFDALIVRGLGLDRHPELRDMYFANYTRVLHLAQCDDPALEADGRQAAERLGLAYTRRLTGLGRMEDFLDPAQGAATRKPAA